MKLKPKKDWTDAIRESYSSDVGAPDAVGWDAIERRLHRSVVLRRSAIAAAIAAAVLLPLSVLLIRSPWQKSLPPTENTVATSGPSPVVPPSGEASGDTLFIAAADSPEAASQATSPAARRSASVRPGQPGQSIQNDLPGQSGQPGIAEESTVNPQPSQPAGGNASAPDSTARKTPAPAEKPALRQIQELVPEDLLAFAEDEPQQRRIRKISVGVSAGAGAIQRNMILNTMSAPYYTKLAYMNLGVRYETDVKISVANINSHYYNDLLTKTASNSYMANAFVPSDIEYRHDLPLSFGLLAKIGLLPWLGVESGVEYTYLHSVADSYLGTQEQRLHFIGIPVRMDAIIWSNRLLEVYAALGGKAEKCVSASLGRIKCDEPRLQWSAELAGGIQYHLWDRVNLYLQPELEWYLTQTDLITYRTEHPLGFALHAGLRFDL